METQVQTQVRLLMEQQAIDLFAIFYRGPMLHYGFTVIVFDFGPSGNVAFKSNLRVGPLCETMAQVIASFSGGPARLSPRGITPELLREMAGIAKETQPAGTGYAIIIGDTSGSAYVSNAVRDDMVRMLENELMPKWRLIAATEAGHERS
jgi:hypothetical protein